MKRMTFNEWFEKLYTGFLKEKEFYVESKSSTPGKRARAVLKEIDCEGK